MRADRLIALLLLLQTHGRMTAQTLAQRLEVSERTIYRDLVALGAAGIPITTESGPGGGCALLDDYRTTLTGFNNPEIQALFPSRLPDPLSALGLTSAQQGAYLKIAAALPETSRRNATFVAERVLLDASSWFDHHEAIPFLSMLHQALWQERQVQICYRHSNGTEEDVSVDPLGLVAKSAIWYMVGACQGKVQVYRVSRIRSAEIQAHISTRPTDFDLGAFWQTWSAAFEAQIVPYMVRMRLMDEGVAVLPEILGEGIRMLLDDPPLFDPLGWRIMVVPFESFYHARTVALGLGLLAEVLEPEELRRSIGEVALHVMQTYQSPQSS